jgi:hypothetical protein
MQRKQNEKNFLAFGQRYERVHTPKNLGVNLKYYIDEILQDRQSTAAYGDSIEDV